MTARALPPVAALQGLIFDIQRFSIQDGPGIRTTVFMKGCPLRCPWCSNPEGMASTPEITTADRKCIACRKCVDICPTGAVRFDNVARIIDWSLCDHCLECAAGRPAGCPSGAIQVSGVYRTVDEVLGVVARDEAFYRTSGGGVTVSGGEPLLQWEYTAGLLRECRKAGYHTALDTSGHCRWEHMETVLDHTDLVLFDVKSTDRAAHRERTGVDNDVILSNLERTARRTAVWLRIPLTPGFNDTESNMRRTAELAAKIKAEKISILPYHDWGREKHPRLGKRFRFQAVPSLAEDSEAVRSCKAILESYGLAVQVGA